MNRFAIVYRPGRQWKDGRPWSEQGLYDHGGYMQRLFDAGTLLYGGPFDDHSGGLAIVEVDDVADAQALVSEDPAVTDGIFEADVHPWVTVFDKPEGVSRFAPGD